MHPAYERVRTLVGNFEILFLKKANHGVALDFLTPKRNHIKHIKFIVLYFFGETLNETY